MGVRFSRFYLLVLISIQLCLAQNNIDPKVSELSFGEIRSVWDNADDDIFNMYFDYYVAKAKKERDTAELAYAYRYRAYNLPLLEGIASVDSSISIISSIKILSHIDYDRFIALSYYTKAALFYENYLDEQAVEAFIKSFDYAKKIDDKSLMIRVLSELANIKGEFGQENEAVLLQKKALDFLKKNRGTISDYDEIYVNSLYSYIRCFTFAKELDSASIYIEKAMGLAIIKDEPFYLNNLSELRGLLHYYQGHILKAKDSLLKYETLNNGGAKADIFFYLGMIEGKLEKPKIKRTYFKSFDSIMRSLDYPLVDNANEVYRFLLKEAIDRDDSVSEKEYFNRLVYYDSLLLRTQERLRKITLEKLDLPLELEEKRALNKTISIKSKLLVAFYVSCALLFLGFLGYYIKYKKTKKRLQHIMQHPVEVKIGLPSSDTKLDKNVTAEILESLNQWEKRKGFLDGKVNQQNLAKVLNTNSSYLSQVINAHKGLNFASYLKDLRITYAINDLKQNPQIVSSKSMIQIAEMYGFSSLTVFNKVLKAKIGVTPGNFFKQIIKDNLFIRGLN
nr:helix-turn-helix domain-containing protein [uncultured Allomuricauda sp.]